MRAATWITVLVALLAVSALVAEEDKPALIFHSDPKAGKTARPERRTPPGEAPAPVAPFIEAEGEFTSCAAAHLLRLELSQRQIETYLRKGTTVKTAKQDLRSQRMIDALEAAVTAGRYDCVERDAVLADQIISIRRTMVDHPELMDDAVALAPMTTYTAARASQLLNDSRGLLRNTKLKGLPSPCRVVDSKCDEEIRRRDRILSAVAADAKESMPAGS